MNLREQAVRIIGLLSFFAVYTTFFLLGIQRINHLHLNPAPPSLDLTPKPIASSPVTDAFEENFYSIFVNEQDTKQIGLFITDKNKNVWISGSELKILGIKLPPFPSINYNDDKFYNLRPMPGVSYLIDSNAQVIKIKFPPNYFPGNKINLGASDVMKFSYPSPGAFFDYDLIDVRNIDSKPHNTFTGLFTLGIFNSYGVGTTSFIIQNTPNTQSPLRLLTTWRYDKPEVMKTLSLGDDISTSTPWSGSVYFGGVQWGTNFSTQPNFITFPQPGIKGQATLPSALDLYVNQTKSGQQNITPGPFEITNIPFVTGAGNLQLVTTDIQGHQQVISMPFYSSTQLLKAGLVQYSYEAGFLRQNLGIANFDYARFMAAATESMGISDKLTAQWHIEALSDQQAVGLSAAKEIGVFGIINASVAASHINAGAKDGGLFSIGFQRQTINYSFNASTEITTTYFTQSGLTPGTLSPRSINQVSGGVTIGGNSLGINYIRLINREAPGINSVTASFSRNLPFKINFALSATTNLGGTKNKGVFLNLTRAFDHDTTVSSSLSEQNGIKQEGVQVLKSLPQGPGYGYSLGGITGTTANTKQGSFSYQNDIQTYTINAFNENHQQSYSGEIAGSAGWLASQSYLMRSLNGNSFAVAEVGGLPNVGVYINNQLSAVTDNKGNALIPNLLPYQLAVIKVDPNSIPLNVEVDSTAVSTAPYYSSGIIIKFPIKVIRNATLTVKQTSGEFIPEGVSIKVNDVAEEFIAADQGQVYLTGLSDTNTVTAYWDTHRCGFNFTMPPHDPNNPIPDLGTFICREITTKESTNAKAS